MLFIAISIMQQCSNKPDIIGKNGISVIIVELDDKTQNIDLQLKQIINPDSLNHIIDELNSSRPEPIKFHLTGRLKLYYNG